MNQNFNGYFNVSFRLGLGYWVLPRAAVLHVGYMNGRARHC